MVRKIAICIGHSRSGDNGATSADGTTEWEFNRHWGELVKEKFDSDCLRVTVYDRYEGTSYTSAMTWIAAKLKEDRVDLAIETHFNAYNGKAHGYEALHWHRSTNGKKLAQSLIVSQESQVPDEVFNRGLKPINSTGRGSQFLRKTHCPAVIYEPFFGDNPEEWALYSGEVHLLVRSLCGGIKDFIANG